MAAGYILLWDLVRWIAENEADHPYFIQWPAERAIQETLQSGG